MTAVDIQIKKAFEQENMTPEEIADDQQLDITAVKARLMQLSPTYRKACGVESIDDTTLNFDNQQLRDANRIIHETMLSAETPDGTIDYRTRLTAAIYLRDDKKGRKEIVKGVGGQSFNILTINNMLQQARLKATESIRELTNGSQRQEIVDVG